MVGVDVGMACQALERVCAGGGGGTGGLRERKQEGLEDCIPFFQSHQAGMPRIPVSEDGGQDR